MTRAASNKRIAEVLLEAQGNRAEAARRLGIHYHTILNRARTSDAIRSVMADLDGRQSHSFRERVSAAKKGIPRSPEARAKISEGLRGEKNHNWGKPISEEQRAKIRAAKKGKYCGPAAPAWRGGVSFEPYCMRFNREFKERVRNFFGRVCVECGAPENRYGLHVHHVNYRKESCCTEDAVPLFVPLCNSCHSKTNHNREYWEERFTALINEQYGGVCYLPKQGAAVTEEVPA